MREESLERIQWKQRTHSNETLTMNKAGRHRMHQLCRVLAGSRQGKRIFDMGVADAVRFQLARLVLNRLAECRGW